MFVFFINLLWMIPSVDYNVHSYSSQTDVGPEGTWEDLRIFNHGYLGNNSSLGPV